MTEELTVEEIEYILRDNPLTMKRIHQSLDGHPALDGMDQARAMRKIRNIMNSSSTIMKVGEKRGTVYAFDPYRAKDMETRGQIEIEIIKIHLKAGGVLATDDEHYSELDDEYETGRVNDALDALIDRGILRMTRTETSLTERVWDISGTTNRSSSSFTHTGATGLIIEELIEKLKSLNKQGGTFLPNSGIPVPQRPSRSAAIEAAVAYTAYSLGK
jgi:hypothetical protein